jgi:hypothetical protein
MLSIELVTQKESLTLGASGADVCCSRPRAAARLQPRAPRTRFLPPASSCVDAPSEPQV